MSPLQVYVCLAKHLYKRKQRGMEGAGAARRITSKRRHNVGGHARESTSEKQRGENKETEPATQILVGNVHYHDGGEEQTTRVGEMTTANKTLTTHILSTLLRVFMSDTTFNTGRHIK